MKKFQEFLQQIDEAIGGPPGGIGAPSGLPPGGPPPGGPGGGGLPPMPPMGGPPPLGGGLGGPPSLGGGPPGGGQQPPAQKVMKLKSPDVWKTLEKILGMKD